MTLFINLYELVILSNVAESFKNYTCCICSASCFKRCHLQAEFALDNGGGPGDDIGLIDIKGDGDNADLQLLVESAPRPYVQPRVRGRFSTSSTTGNRPYGKKDSTGRQLNVEGASCSYCGRFISFHLFLSVS